MKNEDAQEIKPIYLPLFFFDHCLSFNSETNKKADKLKSPVKWKIPILNNLNHT